MELYWERTELGNSMAALDFIVRDNGIGMSEEFQEKMFESFSQEHERFASSGSGLGLAIVKSLITIMGGKISVESKKGVGSTFKVHLEREISEDTQKIAKKTANVSLSGRRILVCEDNAVNVLFITRLLQKWEIITETAENGKEGVEKFALSEDGCYDAILMDVMMPEMNGMDAARAIRALDKADAKTVPIIAMTANAYDTDVENCLEAGMNAHMSKPVEPGALIKLLSEFFEKEDVE